MARGPPHSPGACRDEPREERAPDSKPTACLTFIVRHGKLVERALDDTANRGRGRTARTTDDQPCSSNFTTLKTKA
jgi:hypothetical protein